jgi:ATP phosphoribosyltransferase regulatory subunit HisZ
MRIFGSNQERNKGKKKEGKNRRSIFHWVPSVTLLRFVLVTFGKGGRFSEGRAMASLAGLFGDARPASEFLDELRPLLNESDDGGEAESELKSLLKSIDRAAMEKDIADDMAPTDQSFEMARDARQRGEELRKQLTEMTGGRAQLTSAGRMRFSLNIREMPAVKAAAKT